MSDFSPPAAASTGLAAADADGHLLLIFPTAYETGISTTFGDKDAVRLDVIDLDAGEEWPDSMWFGNYLVGSLKKMVGQKVLARMSKGTAKAGQSAPWVLVDATTDQAAVAKAVQWQNDKAAAGLSAPSPAELI